MAKGWAHVLKIIVIFLDIAIFACGIALVKIGHYIFRTSNVFQRLEMAHLELAMIMTIFLGGFALVVGISSICGVCRENSVILGVDTALTCLILILAVATGVVVTKNMKEQPVAASDRLRGQLGAYWTDNSVRIGLDTLQHNYKCCGVDGPESWRNYKTETKQHDGQQNYTTEMKLDDESHNDTTEEKLEDESHNITKEIIQRDLKQNATNSIGLPDSCCKEYKTNCGVGKLEFDTHRDVIWTRGCAEVLEESARQGMTFARALVAVQASLDVIAIVLTLIFIRAIKKDSSYAI